MKPSQIVRAAIKILTEQGWCQGASAKDHAGCNLLLYEASSAGDGRARINQQAASFSIYGSIAKAMENAGTAVPQAGLMWQVLQALAEAVPEAKGHIHPIVGYNESLNRTKDEVLALMERAAVELEKREIAS